MELDSHDEQRRNAGALAYVRASQRDLHTVLRNELGKAVLGPRIEKLRKRAYRRKLQDDLSKRKN